MAKRRLTAVSAGREPEMVDDAGHHWPAVAAALIVAVLVVLTGIGLQNAADQRPTGALAKCTLPPELAPRVLTSAPRMCIDPARQYSAVINTTKGPMTLTLHPKEAPRTVNNFVVLASNGFYNGLRFWRVEDWVVQTGDPTNSGRFSPGYTLPDEAGKSGWAPGAVGYARSGQGVNGSQFFITKLAWPDGDPAQAYNHFADITLGFDIAGQLTSSDRILNVTVRAG